MDHTKWHLRSTNTIFAKYSYTVYVGYKAIVNIVAKDPVFLQIRKTRHGVFATTSCAQILELFPVSSMHLLKLNVNACLHTNMSLHITCVMIVDGRTHTVDATRVWL